MLYVLDAHVYFLDGSFKAISSENQYVLKCHFGWKRNSLIIVPEDSMHQGVKSECLMLLPQLLCFALNLDPKWFLESYKISDDVFLNTRYLSTNQTAAFWKIIFHHGFHIPTLERNDPWPLVCYSKFPLYLQVLILGSYIHYKYLHQCPSILQYQW